MSLPASLCPSSALLLLAFYGYSYYHMLNFNANFWWTFFLTYRFLKFIPLSLLKQISKQKLTINTSISRKDSISSTQLPKPKTCKYISNLFLSIKLVSSLPRLSLHFQQARPAEMSLHLYYKARVQNPLLINILSNTVCQISPVAPVCISSSPLYSWHILNRTESQEIDV